MNNTYKIAGKVIEINSVYNYVHDLCADYRAEGAPDLIVDISEEDIGKERKKSLPDNNLSSPDYSDDYIESLAVYRKIAEWMPSCNTVLFHASAVALDGEAYLFTAKSGTGKSTHTSLWKKQFGDRAVIINDDKPLLRAEGNIVTVFGTPWDGKHRRSCNISAPVKAICILERASSTTVSPVESGTVLPLLLNQFYRPAGREAMQDTLRLISEITDNVRLYRMGCTMDPDAAITAYNSMKG